MRSLIFPVLALTPMCAYAQQPVLTAADIMARVAVNQDRSDVERKHYVYVQHAHTISRKGKTIRCEETTDYRETPTDKGSGQQLLTLDGRLLVKGNYVHYVELGGPKDAAKNDGDDDRKGATAADEDDSMDRDLVENMRKNLTAAPSKDGIGAKLFPLTSKVQANYSFKLIGRAPMNGRDCYHITFTPHDKDNSDWKGDAWIDAKQFEPVVIRTALYRNVPLAVRMLLGTSVPGLGFTITYAPQPADTPDAVWFPTTFGTEFKLNVLFFLHRTIVLDVKNRDFEKTHVTTTILPPQDAAQQ